MLLLHVPRHSAAGMGLRAVLELSLTAMLLGAFLLPAVHADSAGVCYKKKQYLGIKTEREYVSQLHVYYERRWLRKVSKYRIFWDYDTRTRAVVMYRTEVQCCDGYSRASEFHDCEPVCKDGCQEREECVAPDKCACKGGYIKSDELGICISVCDARGCRYGVCKDLNTCLCYPGYQADEDGADCHPVCKQGCGANAKCIEPDKCSCLYGYEQVVGGGCRPMCTRKLVGAECVNPEKYECLPGYVFEKQTSAEYLCRPVCSSGCQNGKCVAPDSCACLEGYERANSSTCAPICENVCSNGECEEPNTCRCYEGFALDPQDESRSTCQPSCHPPCVGGTCTAPGTCTCYDGYQVPETSVSNASVDYDWLVSSSTTEEPASFNNDSNTCVPVCSRGCNNGVCVKPETCSCLDGYDYDPSDAFNATCVLISQAQAVCAGEECPDSGETSPVSAIAAGSSVAVLLLFLTALFAAMYFMKRRRKTTGTVNIANPSYAGVRGSSSNVAQLLEESCVDEDGPSADNPTYVYDDLLHH